MTEQQVADFVTAGTTRRTGGLATAFCAAAGAGDLVVVQLQLPHGIAYVLPYLIAGVIQFGLAIWIWSADSQRVSAAAAGVLLLLLCAYVLAAAAGVTVGSHGRPEQADPARTVVSVLQLAAIVTLLTRLDGTLRRTAVNVAVLAGVCLWILRISGQLG